MKEFEVNKISKNDFMNLKEENIMFITNPGRMGDEDGIYFIIKVDNTLQMYRVSGWMYSNKSKDENFISFLDAQKVFPNWYETWKNYNNCDYSGKYKYIYMGFGNGLSVDNTIYDLYKPYLDNAVKKYMEEEHYSDEEKVNLEYAAIYNVWAIAIINMANENGYVIDA